MKTLFVILLLSCISATTYVFAQPQGKTYTAEVIKPIDGDRLMIRIPGERKVRELQMIGVDSPEASSREHKGQEPWGTRARQFSVVTLTRKMITVEQDVQTNQGTVLLGYVWLDSLLFNEELIRQGFAYAVSAPPNIRYIDRLRKAQSEATQQQRGFWSGVEPLAESPEQFRQRGQTATNEYAATLAALSLPAFREGCIIGNKKTKRYHTPASRFYKKAAESKHAIFFASPEDAEKAGFTKSQ